MLIYAVRLTENKEAVGIFCVQKKQDLFFYVDECTDPYACEIKPISSEGGIYFTENSSRLWTDYEDNDDCYPSEKWSGTIEGNEITTSGYWDKYVHNDKGWKPLT